MVTVFFKELNQHKDVTLRFFDRQLHAGFITYTNNYGWFLNPTSNY